VTLAFCDDGPWLQRHPAVRLRPEAEGGLAFHRGSGDLLELDEHGFDALHALGRACTLRALAARVSARGHVTRLPELASFVGALHARGFVRPSRAGTAPLPSERLGEGLVAPECGRLRAPLVAHWALTYRCNLACAFCYADSGPWREAGPGPERRRRLVERLARWGVFEVAIGGGEPTVVPDLPAVLAAVADAGMVPNVTTNGLAMPDQVLGALAAHAGVVHLSADAPDALDAARGAGVSRRLRATAGRLRGAGVRFGVNLLLLPRHARDLRRSLDAAVELGASAVTLLRPKGDWAREHCPGFPTAAELRAFARALRAFVRERPALRLSVDTALRREWALAGLLADPEPKVLGCGGAQRHVALTPEGDVYPCSHARRPGFAMGNLLTDEPRAIWAGQRGSVRYLAACEGERCPCAAPLDASGARGVRGRLPVVRGIAAPARTGRAAPRPRVTGSLRGA
jgi:MoaA/NifB/PqqE/SkfB family radical SAM enzyme